MNAYAPIQKILHWLIAALVLGALGLGAMIGFYEFKGLVEAFGPATTNLIYKYHKTAGVIILALMIARLIAKRVYPSPPYDPPLKPWERKVSAAVHHGLYACLLAMPVLGWLATGAGGYPVEFFEWRLPGVLGENKDVSAILYQLHGAIGWLTIVLAFLHIGGAMKHAMTKGDTVLRRMI